MQGKTCAWQLIIRQMCKGMCSTASSLFGGCHEEEAQSKPNTRLIHCGNDSLFMISFWFRNIASISNNAGSGSMNDKKELLLCMQAALCNLLS